MHTKRLPKNTSALGLVFFKPYEMIPMNSSQNKIPVKDLNSNTKN
jgi:hypothetical protein